MISIIGGGPVGGYLAGLLAKDREVSLFEEHSSIGRPVQCTGLVTKDIKKFVDIDGAVVNKVNGVRISSSNESFEIKIDENYVLDRAEFDKMIIDKAADNGAKLFLGSKLLGFRREDGRFKLRFNDMEVESDILIGADGVSSAVAREGGFLSKELVHGIQARVDGEFNKDLIDFYLFKEGFGWIVPESSKVARVGAVTKEGNIELFNRLVKDYKIKEYQGGIIPVYNSKLEVDKGDLYLVGDAAGQVKATTYGGLLFGMMAAKKLSEAILFGGDYRKLCREVNKELMYGKLIRNRLNKFSDKDYDYLIGLFKGERLSRILSEYDRDYPSKFIFKILVREPRLLRFMV